MEYPLRYLYARTRRGAFLEMSSRFWGTIGNYPGPVAVVAGTRPRHARQADISPFRVDFSPHNTDPRHPRDAIVHRVIPPEAGILHYYWVRSEEHMRRKAGWSGHSDTYSEPRRMRAWRWRQRHPLLTTLSAPVHGLDNRFRLTRLAGRPDDLGGGVVSPEARGTVAFVNNSRETFTPTVSGAIATCILEVGRAAIAEGFDCPVVSRPADAEPYPWPGLHLTTPIRSHGAAVGTALRARRRLNGWARPDQWSYAHDVLEELDALKPRVAVVSNDPEIAVFLRNKRPDLRVVHWFHNLEMSSDRYRRRFAADPGLRSVAVSRYLARAVEQVYQLTPLSVAVALNGVAAERFSTERRAPKVTVGLPGPAGGREGSRHLGDRVPAARPPRA